MVHNFDSQLNSIVTDLKRQDFGRGERYEPRRRGVLKNALNSVLGNLATQIIQLPTSEGIIDGKPKMLPRPAKPRDDYFQHLEDNAAMIFANAFDALAEQPLRIEMYDELVKSIKGRRPFKVGDLLTYIGEVFSFTHGCKVIAIDKDRREFTVQFPEGQKFTAKNGNTAFVREKVAKRSEKKLPEIYTSLAFQLAGKLSERLEVEKLI